MNRTQIFKWGLRTIWIIGFILVFCTDIVIGQTRPQSKPKVEVINDGNFKSKISKGFVLVKFTAGYQMKNFDPKLFDGVVGHEGCIILTVPSENAKKVIKKLRIRNYPSLALFHNGSKKEVWKADMDGIVDIKNKDIKKAIDDVLAGDVF